MLVKFHVAFVFCTLDFLISLSVKSSEWKRHKYNKQGWGQYVHIYDKHNMSYFLL